MGIELFVHSVRLVTSDWRNALRISGVLYLICAIPSVLIALIFPQPVDPSQIGAAAAGAILPNLVAGILYAVAFVWLAVAWHRYVLANEVPPGPIPEFNGPRLLTYFGYSLLIVVVLVGIGIVMGIVSFAVGAILGPLLLVVPVFFYFVMTVIGYRLSPLLPAAALERRLLLGEAWSATSGASGAIAVLAIVSVLSAIAINLPAVAFAFIGGIGPILVLLWTFVTGWIVMMVGVSILTTIYGHYVEGRPLATD